MKPLDRRRSDVDSLREHSNAEGQKLPRSGGTHEGKRLGVTGYQIPQRLPRAWPAGGNV